MNYYFRSTARFVNKVERLSFATLALVLITCAVSIRNWMKLQKANGLVPIVTSTVLRTKRLMKKMNTWSSAASARKGESCYAAIAVLQATILHAVSRL